MVSQLEKEGVQKKDYFGLKMFDLTPEYKPLVHASFTWSKDKKAMQEGVLSFDRHEGSYRFSNEVVISVWSKSPPVLNVDRAYNDGYYRIEIPVDQHVFLKMIDRAQKRLRGLE
jgi:hypothetical protein